MTVRISTIQPVLNPSHNGHYCAAPIWSNFWSIITSDGKTPYSNDELAAVLKDWGAVWLRTEAVLEFETEEAVVLFLLRWS